MFGIFRLKTSRCAVSWIITNSAWFPNAPTAYATPTTTHQGCRATSHATVICRATIPAVYQNVTGLGPISSRSSG